MSIIGYYLDCDNALCISCFEDEYSFRREQNGEYEYNNNFEVQVENWKAQGGFEGWDEPLAIEDNEETDSPTHCCDCGILIAQILSAAGGRYVAEAIMKCFAAGKRNPITQQWLNEYWEDTDVRKSLKNLWLEMPLDEVWNTRADLSKYLRHI